MSVGRPGLGKMPEILARLTERLPAVLIDSLRDQGAMIGQLDERIHEIGRRLNEWKKSDPPSRRSARYRASAC